MFLEKQEINIVWNCNVLSDKHRTTRALNVIETTWNNPFSFLNFLVRTLVEKWLIKINMFIYDMAQE